jgi:hypothetical protein
MITNCFSKRVNVIPLTVIFCLAMVYRAAAAPDIAPVPRLATAPSESAWTIDYQYKSPNPLLKPPDPSYTALFEKMRSENPRLLNVQVVKAGDRRNEIYQYDDGSQTVWWVVKDSLVIDMRLSHFLTFNTSSDPLSPRFTHDFDSLAWIDQAEYQGHKIFQGADCCVYYTKGTADHGEETAYIDAKSGLPIGAQQGDVTLSYTFKSSNKAIEIPPKVDAEISRYGSAEKK